MRLGVCTICGAPIGEPEAKRRCGEAAPAPKRRKKDQLARGMSGNKKHVERDACDVKDAARLAKRRARIRAEGGEALAAMLAASMRHTQAYRARKRAKRMKPVGSPECAATTATKLGAPDGPVVPHTLATPRAPADRKTR